MGGGGRWTDRTLKSRALKDLIKALFTKVQAACNSPVVGLIPPLDQKVQEKGAVSGPR